MIDLDRFQEVGQTMRRNALRTALTAVGVFWGVLLLIVMVGFGNGLEAGARKSMGRMATNSLYIWGQRTSVPYRGQSPGRGIQLTLEDALALAEVEGVGLVAPRASLGGRRGSQVVTRGTKGEAFTVMGDVPRYLEVEPMAVRGRFVNALDMAQKRKVAVIGTRVQELLFNAGEEPIGQTIRIQGVEFMVVGVFKTEQSGERGTQHASTIYTPLTTFQKALSNSREISYIAVLSAEGVRASAVEDTLVDRLRQRHRVAPDDKQAIGSFNADAEFQKVVNLFKGINALIALVAAATLMAGLVGVSNIMMVSVRERTREIGIRKAIGATPRTVIAQVVLEAVVLATSAGYVGLVVGVAVLELAGRMMNPDDPSSVMAPPFVSLTTAVVAAVAVAIGGGLSGLFPALHAARIRTVDALRDE
ncbi:MAG: ABC transporter permease [Myxococcales bacterium]|nr:ABC transporter permease [Myxococcales bacterium]